MGKLKVTSTYPPAIWNKPDGSKVIVAGTITAVNNKPWSKPYVKVKSFVEKTDIIWEAPPKPAPVKEITHTVKGSKGDVYTVTRRANGSWFCSCMGFHYRKTCRHVTDLTK